MDFPYNIIGIPWKELIGEDDPKLKVKQISISYLPYCSGLNRLWYYQLQDYYKRPIKKVKFFNDNDYINRIDNLSLVEAFKFIELSTKITNDKAPLEFWDKKFKILNLENNMSCKDFNYIIINIIKMILDIRNSCSFNFNIKENIQHYLYFLSEDEIKYLANIAKLDKFTATSYISHNENIKRFLTKKLISPNVKINFSHENLRKLWEINYYSNDKNITPFEYIQLTIEFYKTLDEISKLYPQIRRIFIKLGILEEGYIPEIKMPEEEILIQEK